MSLFTDKAPPIMVTLMMDFPWTKEDAAAALGNIGHECSGFKAFQELKPLVAGSRGGYGWPMWTGPRRRAFEAYCARNGLDPKSDRANYGFLFVELMGSEHATVAATASASGLYNKTKAFERAFERAGVKHYDRRYGYALQALAAYEALEAAGKLRPLFPVDVPASPPPSQPAPVPIPQAPPPAPAPVARQPDDPGVVPVEDPPASSWALVTVLVTAAVGIAIFFLTR